jgi:flagellar biosynthesis chaperone FliJ
MDTQAQLEKISSELQMAKYQIEEDKKLIESLRNEKIQQRKQLKEMEEKVNKYENSYNPKLKETRKFQK